VINFLKIQKFDKVTQFRLINAFFVAISMSLMAPIAVVLKGTYMLTWIISGFSIAYTIAVKTNKYMVPLGNEKLYRTGIFIHLLYIGCSTIYFFSPLVMIWVNSIIVFFEIVVFSAYSITLQNYITKYYPKDVPSFQITRNNLIANGSIIGLILVTVVSLHSLTTAVVFFILFNSLFSFWMLYHWNFFRNVPNGKRDINNV